MSIQIVSDCALVIINDLPAEIDITACYEAIEYDHLFSACHARLDNY